MNVQEMTLPELIELAQAIKAQAAKRMRECQDIIGAGDSRKPHGNAGHKIGDVRYPMELFQKASAGGMTAKKAAIHIGCHVSYIRAVAKKHGLVFLPGKPGPK